MYMDYLFYSIPFSLCIEEGRMEVVISHSNPKRSTPEIHKVVLSYRQISDIGSGDG